MTLAEELNAMETELKKRRSSLNKLCGQIGIPLSTVWRWRQGGDAKMETYGRVKEAYAAIVAE